jgi:hypothetical protein
VVTCDDWSQVCHLHTGNPHDKWSLVTIVTSASLVQRDPHDKWSLCDDWLQVCHLHTGNPHDKWSLVTIVTSASLVQRDPHDEWSLCDNCYKGVTCKVQYLLAATVASGHIQLCWSVSYLCFL